MLKVVIAGCGFISGKKHIPVFLRLRNKVEIVAVCDLNENAAKELASKFNIKKYYNDFSKMLLEIKPDIVDICTPPQTHTKLTIQALNSGANVILEKPMALNVSDCNAMISAANENNKQLGIIHNQIFNPSMIKAKELIAKGAIGKIFGVQVLLSTPIDYMTSSKEHWAHKLPGGVLGETGPHAVYLVSAFLNNIKDVSIQAKKHLHEYPWSSYEDFRFDLIGEDGIGSVVLFYGGNQWASEINILGSNGILKIDLQARIVIKYNRASLNPFELGQSVLSCTWQTLKMAALNAVMHLSGRKIDGHSIGIAEFVDSILENRKFRVSGEDGRETVRIMEMLVNKFEKKQVENFV